MRLGIMGGTFDPIHNGHLFVAEEARIRFRLNNVLFVPNGQPPHKQELKITPSRMRYAMALIATHSNQAFGCSPVESNRPGPSYAVDTLRSIREQNPDAELYYITGIDAVADILSWNRHEEVIQLATFIAAMRPGYNLVDLRDKMPRSYLERILLLGSTYLGISSTDIRSRLEQSLPVRYLMPDAVLDYIFKNSLYGTNIAPPGADANSANASGESVIDEIR